MKYTSTQIVNRAEKLSVQEFEIFKEVMKLSANEYSDYNYNLAMAQIRKIEYFLDKERNLSSVGRALA